MEQTERAAWLESRRKGIGSSDAAALLLPPGSAGVFGTPLRVFADKLGLLPDEDSGPMRWGRLLEPVVARAFEIETGRQVPALAGRLSQTVYRHKRHPWMLATPDFLVDGGDSVLECKTADARYASQGWGPSGTDIVPEGYLIQCQHQLAVLGLARAYLAVLIGGNDFRWYMLPRHEELIRRMIAIEGAFWRNHVEARVPPAEDWSHPDTPRLLELIHRPTPDAPEVMLDAHGEMVVEHFLDLKEQIKELEREESKERAVLFRLLGEATIGRTPNGRVVERKIVNVAAHQRAESKQVRLIIKGGSNVE